MSSPGLESPSDDFSGNVTPSDAVPLRKPSRGIRVYGTAGDIAVVTVSGHTDTWHSVQVGETILTRCTILKATGTTATGFDIHH